MINDNSKMTIYDCLTNKYKLIIKKIKLDYYIKMNNHEKEYFFRDTKLESILLRDSNDKEAYDLLLLMLILENHKDDIEQNDVERCYKIVENYKEKKQSR